MPARRTINDLLADARSRIERVEPQDVGAALAAGALLVDTRSSDQRREAGVIPGSVHVPLSVLPWRLDPAAELPDPVLADPGRQVILVCDDGYSSSLAAATLRDIGYDRAADLAGGFNGWRAAGMPVEPADR
jgi:rhodanese-related sulfurtransferase